jgi:hypothetical protein
MRRWNRLKPYEKACWLIVACIDFPYRVFIEPIFASRSSMIRALVIVSAFVAFLSAVLFDGILGTIARGIVYVGAVGLAVSATSFFIFVGIYMIYLHARELQEGNK